MGPDRQGGHGTDPLLPMPLVNLFYSCSVWIAIINNHYSPLLSCLLP